MRAKAYLKGLQQADAAEFKRNFSEIARNYQALNTVRLDQMPEYGRGFLYGFFVDGALGNVTGLYEAGKIGFSIWWAWKTKYSPAALGARYAMGDEFASEQAILDKTEEYTTMAYQITQVLGTELGEQAFEHYRVLTEGTAEELRALGDTHQQVAAAMLGIAAELSKELAKVSPYLKGQITGAIYWEVLQTVVEILLSGGASKAVTGTATFAHIADKLADFGKYAGKLGDYAHTVARIFKESVRFRQLCEKLDMVADGVRYAANLVCFTRDTVVATEKGLKPIGEIEPGERVQSFDFTSGKWTLGEVTKRHDNVYNGRVVTVQIGRNKIEATAGHPFWVLDGEDLNSRAIPRELDEFEDEGKSLPGRWVNSHDLRAGDLVIGVDGDHRRIDAVTIQEESGLPISNLTVRGFHSYAVGRLAILVHNGKAFCDVYRDAIDRVAKSADAATQAALKAKKAVSLALVKASKAAGDVTIHAHHIVLKTVSLSDRWAGRAPDIRRAQKVLEDVEIPLLAKLDDFETKVKKADDLANMTWALNGEGVHSGPYCKKVADLLEAALKSGATKAEKRANVLEALERMATTLSKGEKFW